MSTEGVTHLTRVGFVLYLLVVGTAFRTWVGTSRRRGEIMMVGTIGGLSLGVLVAWLISDRLKIDASAVCACLGLTAGWVVSWWFARRSRGEARV
jgi:hypothetical protein